MPLSHAMTQTVLANFEISIRVVLLSLELKLLMFFCQNLTLKQLEIHHIQAAVQNKMRSNECKHCLAFERHGLEETFSNFQGIISGPGLSIVDRRLKEGTGLLGNLSCYPNTCSGSLMWLLIHWQPLLHLCSKVLCFLPGILCPFQ
mmetsp:Transcript_5434/g.13250  ORF Transcript_5434/g.13250 Transcript_5434/m.13250 type:complete len:146 (-) Transcript_5434:821-1258(-)